MRKALKIGLFALCAAVFFAVALNLQSEWLQGFDLSVTQWLAARRVDWVTGVMKGFTRLASPAVLLIVCLGLMYGLRKKHYSIPVAVNLMVSIFLNYGLKTRFLRARPPMVYRAVAEKGYSFPSGHAMASAAFYGFLIYIVWHSRLSKAAKRGCTAALTVMIAMIGFSRVYLGVHYGSDVLAGFAVSTAYLLAFCALVGCYLRAGQTTEAVVPTEIKKNKRFSDSFRHAFDGIAGAMKTERNLMIHFAAMAMVTAFGFIFSISTNEWIACVVLFGVVVGAELINTAIETTVDICMPHSDPRAKLAKDTAAGAVLMISIAAAIVGAMIFLPKLLPMLHDL